MFWKKKSFIRTYKIRKALCNCHIILKFLGTGDSFHSYLQVSITARKIYWHCSNFCLVFIASNGSMKHIKTICFYNNERLLIMYWNIFVNMEQWHWCFFGGCVLRTFIFHCNHYEVPSNNTDRSTKLSSTLHLSVYSVRINNIDFYTFPIS